MQAHSKFSKRLLFCICFQGQFLKIYTPFYGKQGQFSFQICPSFTKHSLKREKSTRAVCLKTRISFKGQHFISLICSTLKTRIFNFTIQNDFDEVVTRFSFLLFLYLHFTDNVLQISNISKIHGNKMSTDKVGKRHPSKLRTCAHKDQNAVHMAEFC